MYVDISHAKNKEQKRKRKGADMGPLIYSDGVKYHINKHLHIYNYGHKLGIR